MTFSARSQAKNYNYRSRALYRIMPAIFSLIVGVGFLTFPLSSYSIFMASLCIAFGAFSGIFYILDERSQIDVKYYWIAESKKNEKLYIHRRNFQDKLTVLQEEELQVCRVQDIVHKKHIVIREKQLKDVFDEAVTILYLDDNSDYKPALWSIARMIRPDIKELRFGDINAVYEKHVKSQEEKEEDNEKHTSLESDTV